MNPLFALLLGNGLWGAALGVLFVIGVLVLDLGHLRKLFDGSADSIIGLAVLTGGSVITFASVAMGGAIMLLPRDDDHGPQGGASGKAPVGRPAFVRMPAKRTSRRKPN